MRPNKSVYIAVAAMVAMLGSTAIGVSAQEQQRPAAPQSVRRGSVTGVVTAAEGGGPLEAVQVRIVGTSLGATTGEGGRYAIPNVNEGVYSIEAARIGYAPRRQDNVSVTAGAPVVVNFAMSPNALRLNDVIVAGVTDPTSGVRVPFVVTKLTPDDVPVPTLGSTANLIKGKVAGATIRTAGGPGGGAFVQLRNPVSVRASTSPMYIVDGVIMLDTFGGYTSEIDPADIASIEVIKGAAASALYGSKAANGVISVTTNRGQSIAQGAARYTLRSEAGISRLGDQIPLSKHHNFLVDNENQYIDENGVRVSRLNRVADPNGFVDNRYGGRTYDHVDQLFSTGMTFNNQATVGQNTLATNFLTTVGATEETGVLRGAEGVKRNNIRVNVDHRAGDRFSLSVGAYYNNWKERSLSGSQNRNIFRDFVDIEPEVDLLARNPDGSPYIRNPDPLEADLVNPLYREAIRRRTQRRGGIQANSSANVRLTDMIQLSGNFGFQRVDILNQYFLPAGIISSGTTVSTGQIQRQADYNEAMNFEAGASFVTQVRDFNIRSRLSVAGELSKGLDFQAVAESLTVGGREDLDIGLRQYIGSDTRFDRRAKSLIGSTALEYRERYILEGVLRRDGNSRYGPRNRWQNNGRVSAAWRAAEEAWWPIPAIDEFKLRVSQGSAGNNPELNDQFQLFNFSNGRIIKTAAGNLALTPENTTEREMGLDMSILNRFGVELTYARQVSENLLRANEILSFGGFESQVQNVGTIIGNTYEATVEAHWFNGSRFRWNSTLVADRSRARITKYNREACPDSFTRYCPGVTFGEMYGNSLVQHVSELNPIHRTNGTVDQFDRNDDGLLVAVGPNGSWRDGRWGQVVTIDGIDYRWGMPIIERNPDGSNTFKLMAQGLPAFQFGLTNNFTFGAFNAYILFNGQAGGKNYNDSKRQFYDEGVHGDVDQSGKPDYAKKPLVYYNGGSVGPTAGLSDLNTNDFFIEDASYVKLDELLFGYTLPSTNRFTSRLGLDRTRVSVVGRNLYSFTKYSGYDPEVQSATARFDDLDYPRYRTVTLQLELVF